MDDISTPLPDSTANPTPSWSSIVKTQQAPKPQHQCSTPTSQVFVESCKSNKGIAVAVVDANALIQGGEKLGTCADKFVSVPEVLDEVRDPMSRHRLAFTPFSLDPMEPSPEAMNKVFKFARATGDLQTLSDVDLKLIALTYTLEAQIHGTQHLRECPPPVHMVNTKRLPEKDMPGWGSNVPNLEEWEALEDKAQNSPLSHSRILPLQDLNLNVIPSDGHSVDGLQELKDEAHSDIQIDVECSSGKPRRFPPKKREINVEGKKMVADGVDAPQGEFDGSNGDWMPAVCRSTHRRFLRRKARRALSEKDSQQDEERSNPANIREDTSEDLPQLQNTEETYNVNEITEEGQVTQGNNDNDSISSILEQMRLEEVSLTTLPEETVFDSSAGLEGEKVDMDDTTIDKFFNMAVEEDNDITEKEGLEHFEISSQTNESVDTSFVDDDNSEQSWMLRSLSESTVACVTSDFAMQNVLLQMGLRLLAPGGMQIRQLHRWILKCHACYMVTAEVGRVFCPKCGNGGTLRKVAVTVGENGVVLAARKPRITLRGTKFSLPKPQGGRDAITKNLILREDQLPQKYIYPKTKKKVSKEGDEFFSSSDNIFGHHTDKRAPLQPPMRKALAVFSGRRNPNDNHYSRSMHK